VKGGGQLMVLCFVVLLSDACAEDLETFVARSGSIGVVVIDSASSVPVSTMGSGCGFAYSALVVNGIRHMQNGRAISFRSNQSLMMLGTYLVFLRDKTSTKNELDSSGFLDARSERCLESGIPATPMKLIGGDSWNGGPEAILEMRRLPGSDLRNYHKSDFYFFGPPIMEKMINAGADTRVTELKAIRANIEYARVKMRKVEFLRDSLLDYIFDLSGKGRAGSE